jgi:hypothetical protein
MVSVGAAFSDSRHSGAEQSDEPGIQKPPFGLDACAEMAWRDSWIPGSRLGRAPE